MNLPIIDAHIHLDKYEQLDREDILNELTIDRVEALIAVSWDLKSSRKNLELTLQNKKIKPAFGYHPEQLLPTAQEIAELLKFIEQNHKSMVAIGEVGLPYYLRQKNPDIEQAPYIEILETFMQAAQLFNKPIVLHAVYDDAPVVCDLLEKHAIEKAHFHWFKGDQQTIERMITNGYFISITPDVLYEQEIRQLVQNYPLDLMMVETDGPWEFEGIFKSKMTHPRMIHQVIREIATIKDNNISTVYKTLYENAKRFYNI